MSLPLPWVDRIFEKLTLVYGQPFLNRWRDIDLNAVKFDWAHELSGFEAHPDAIKWALQNLPPDTPPTVLQFRTLCRKSPTTEFQALPSPAVNVQLANEVIAKLKAMPVEKVDHKAWAKALISRHEAGEKLKPVALLFARQALGMAA